MTMSDVPRPEDRKFLQFESALRQFIQEHMPSHPGVFPCSDAANDEAWRLAEKHAGKLWSDMHHE